MRNLGGVLAPACPCTAQRGSIIAAGGVSNTFAGLMTLPVTYH